MSIIRPMVRPAVRAATRPSSGLYQSKIVLVDATLRRYMGTFTRNGAATYFDSNGVLQTAAANVPRWQYDPATGQLQGLLIEESRTNLVPRSWDFSTYWTTFAGSPTFAKTATDLFGNSNSAYIISDSSGSFSIVIDLTTLPTSTSAYLSVYAIFKKAPSATCNAMIYCRNYGGSSYLAFSQSDGSVTTDPSNGGANTYVIDYGVQDKGGYWLAYMVLQNTNGGNNCVIELGGDAAGSITPLHFQAEEGSFFTSPIITDGSHVTRAADDAVISDLSGFDLTQGTFVFKGDVEGLIAMNILGNGSLQYLGINAAGNIVATDGTNSVQSANAVSANTSFKTAVSYSGGSASVCLNGATVAAGTFNASLPSSLDLSGYIHAYAVTYYPYAMTASQLQAATA